VNLKHQGRDAVKKSADTRREWAVGLAGDHRAEEPCLVHMDTKSPKPAGLAKRLLASQLPKQ